jgi:hypothetical protein
MRSFLIVLSILVNASAFAQEIKFLFNSKDVHTLKQSALAKGQVTVNGIELSSEKKAVYNPFRKYTKSYEGYNFFAILDAVYGPKWRQAESIRFMALDGFTQVAPIKKMIERSYEHNGIMAFKEADRKDFEKFEKNGKQVDPGPFYLLWTNFEGRQLASYADHLKWPYQLSQIVIVGKEK